MMVQVIQQHVEPFLMCSLAIPTILSIKPFDLGWYGGICVMHTPLVWHPSIGGSLMNSPRCQTAA
eukprot:1021946-Prorocentrum_lima.AAC.1